MPSSHTVHGSARLTMNQLLVLGETWAAKSSGQRGGSYCPTTDERRTMATLERRGLVRKAAHPNPRAEYSPPRYELTGDGEKAIANIHTKALAEEARLSKRLAAPRRKVRQR